MTPKLKVLRQIVEDLATGFPELTAGQEIYLAPKIMSVSSMSPLEIQVCEGTVQYGDQEGSCRDEDFYVHVGIFRKYKLDSGGRHSKALSDLNLSIYELKELVIDLLAGKFLTGNLLTRPLIIRSEAQVVEPEEGQLLKTLHFTAGLNVGLL